MNDDLEWTPITTPWVGAVLRVGRAAGLRSPATRHCWLWRVDAIGSRPENSPGYGEAETEAATRAAMERDLLDAGTLTAQQAASLAQWRTRQAVGDHDAS